MSRRWKQILLAGRQKIQYLLNLHKNLVKEEKHFLLVTRFFCIDKKGCNSRHAQNRRIKILDRENLFGKSGIDYYSGFHTGIKWNTQLFRNTVDYNIIPNNGFKINFDIRRESNLFYSPEKSLFEIKYNNFDFFRAEGKGEAHFQVPFTDGWTFSTGASAGWMSIAEVDSFFNFFAGGMPGIKGYPFNAIEGNRMITGTGNLKIPLMRQTNYQKLSHNLCK